MSLSTSRFCSFHVLQANFLRSLSSSNPGPNPITTKPQRPHALAPPCAKGLCDLPVIKTPQKMIQKLEKMKEKRRSQRRESMPRVKGPLVISCARKDYNFYRNQMFNKNEDFFKLVSCGWKNRKRNGDSFTLMPHADNPSVQHDVTFDDLGLNEQLCKRLYDMGCDRPTHIQRLAIPTLLRGDNTLCAAETGSGKTLSYLVPTVERISLQKRTVGKQRLSCNSVSVDNNFTTGNPHSVIISPTRELSEQVLAVAQSLTSSTDVIPQCVVGGTLKKSDLKQFTDCPMDILITTPGILNKMLRSKCLRRSNLQSLIIDEADTLLDDSFLGQIHDVFHSLQVSVSEFATEHSSPYLGGVQLGLVSATLPRDLDNAVGHFIPVDTMTKVTTDHLHLLMPHVPQTFHRINPDSKPEKLIPLLKKSLDKQEVCLIFAKNSQTCFFLKKLLRTCGISCLIMNGELTAKEREGIFGQFKEGYCDVMVATDIASRGLDTTNVHHVINYDFPSFMSDYVHRVGRVGRMGTTHAGCVTSFVAHKWDVDLLWKIETSARMGSKLENVNANIKRKFHAAHADDDFFSIDAVS